MDQTKVDELESLFRDVLGGYQKAMTAIIYQSSDQPKEDAARLEVECFEVMEKFFAIVEDAPEQE